MNLDKSLLFTIEPTHELLDDKHVINQIPAVIRKSLGENEGAGFDLNTGERHMFFAAGTVCYSSGNPEVLVEFD